MKSDSINEQDRKTDSPRDLSEVPISRDEFLLRNEGSRFGIVPVSLALRFARWRPESQEIASTTHRFIGRTRTDEANTVTIGWASQMRSRRKGLT